MPVSIESIVETLHQNRASLVGYAWIVVGDAQLADDVYQDVSIAAIQKADQINGPDHLLPWLRQAIRLRGLELRRKRGQQNVLLSPEVLDLFEAVETDHLRANESDRMASLRLCIESLPKHTREILALRYTEDLKPAEIAHKIGKSDQAVYKSIKRIHLLLMDCVRQRLQAIGGQS